MSNSIPKNKFSYLDPADDLKPNSCPLRIPRSNPSLDRHSFTAGLQKSPYNSDTDDLDDAEEMDDTPSSLLLTPFTNQVGGHASFLRFSEKALCKPLDSREQLIYELLEAEYPQLTPHVASYLGVVNVTFRPTKSTSGFSFTNDSAPMVILDQNQHLLAQEVLDNSKEVLDQDKTDVLDHQDNLLNPDQPKKRLLNQKEKFLTNEITRTPFSRSRNGSHDSVNDYQSVNRRLQQKVFREALSPKSMTARYARLKEMSGVPISPPTNPQPSSNVPKADLSPSQCSPVDSQTDLNASIFQMSDDEQAKEAEPSKSEPSYFEASGSGSFNPWSIHLYNTRMAKLNSESKLASSSAGRDCTQKFILMEDLTHNLKFPCVLDLKMGTRQYGVNASFEKKLSQELKCDRSTSRKLGVRICGMQVFLKLIARYIDPILKSINISTSTLAVRSMQITLNNRS